MSPPEDFHISPQEYGALTERVSVLVGDVAELFRKAEGIYAMLGKRCTDCTLFRVAHEMREEIDVLKKRTTALEAIYLKLFVASSTMGAVVAVIGSYLLK